MTQATSPASPRKPGMIGRLFKRPPTVAVVRLAGAISAESRFGGGLNHRAVAPLIDAAFAMKPKAVALEINSPGGSPAQSGLIARRIRRLADEENVPVYAFCEDAAASGGYLLACAADEIYADEYAIVGSIGVISAGFGFTEAMEKVGVERRLHTIGTRKRLLDPFSPEDTENIERLKELQTQIYNAFVAWVRTRRGDRLVETDAEPLFEGDVWVGAMAQQRGLIDGIAHIDRKMKDLYGEKVRFKRVEPRRRGLLARMGGGVSAGAAIEALPGRMASELEARAEWSRFGL